MRAERDHDIHATIRSATMTSRTIKLTLMTRLMCKLPPDGVLVAGRNRVLSTPLTSANEGHVGIRRAPAIRLAPPRDRESNRD